MKFHSSSAIMFAVVLKYDLNAIAPQYQVYYAF